MAKIKNKHILLKDNEKLLLGDSDDAELYFDSSTARFSGAITFDDLVTITTGLKGPVSVVGRSTVDSVTQIAVALDSDTGGTVSRLLLQVEGSKQGLIESTNAGVFGIYSGDSFTDRALDISSDGHVTKPLTSCFLAIKNVDDTNNISKGSFQTIIYGFEDYDQSGDYDDSTGIFTAPATGKYLFCCDQYLAGIPIDTSYLALQLVTTLRTYITYRGSVQWDQPGSLVMSIHQIVEMTAGNTAYIQFRQEGGTDNVLDIRQHSYFSGGLFA